MNIRPLPGYMIVKLEKFYANTGLIKVPLRFQKAPNMIGTITALAVRPEDRRVLGVDLAVGDRIIVSNLGGRFLEESLWLYPITLKRKDERGRKYADSGVLAIVGAAVNLAPHSQDIERCAFCGPVRDSNQNIMMSRGVCPRCGKNVHGDIPDRSAVKVDDRHVEAFRGAERKAWEESHSTFAAGCWADGHKNN